MTDHHIRALRDDDIDQVIAIWHAAGVARPWNDPLADIALARRGPHTTILVAREGASLVGSVMVGHDGHRGWVYYLASHPEHRGQGIGRALMAACEAWLVERGLPKIQVMVRSDNTPVLDFYAHLGYEPQDVAVLGRRLD